MVILSDICYSTVEQFTQVTFLNAAKLFNL